jgi:hypothetical protein
MVLINQELNQDFIQHDNQGKQALVNGPARMD